MTDAKTAAAAAAGSSVDAAGVLVAAGCVHVQSFVLLDISGRCRHRWGAGSSVREGRGGEGLGAGGGGGDVKAPAARVRQAREGGGTMPWHAGLTIQCQWHPPALCMAGHGWLLLRMCRQA
jgi:hypothetical protein